MTGGQRTSRILARVTQNGPCDKPQVGSLLRKAPGRGRWLPADLGQGHAKLSRGAQGKQWGLKGVREVGEGP